MLGPWSFCGGDFLYNLQTRPDFMAMQQVDVGVEHRSAAGRQPNSFQEDVAFFSFARRFFSPGSHKWQYVHRTPFSQPFVYKNAQGLQVFVRCPVEPRVGSSGDPNWGESSASVSRRILGAPRVSALSGATADLVMAEMQGADPEAL